MNKIKKYIWMGLGFASLGMAYVGVVVPGIPFSIFLVFAAYCFAKVLRECTIGYTITNTWAILNQLGTKKVFPTKGKYLMIAVMASSLIFLWFTMKISKQ